MWNWIKLQNNLRKGAILFCNRMFRDESDTHTEWCGRIISRAVEKVPAVLRMAGIFRSCTSSFGGGRGETSTPSNLVDFIAGQTTPVASPAISYDSNFVFPLTGNGRSTLKNIGAAGPEVSGKQSCAVRACKPICQFHGAAAPKNGVGKIVRVLFSPKVKRFPADRDVLFVDVLFTSQISIFLSSIGWWEEIAIFRNLCFICYYADVVNINATIVMKINILLFGVGRLSIRQQQIVKRTL